MEKTHNLWKTLFFVSIFPLLSIVLFLNYYPPFMDNFIFTYTDFLLYANLIFIPLLICKFKYPVSEATKISIMYYILLRSALIFLSYNFYYSQLDNPSLRLMNTILRSFIEFVLYLFFSFGYAVIVEKKETKVSKFVPLYMIAIVSATITPVCYAWFTNVSFSFMDMFARINPSFFFEALYTIPLWYAYVTIKKRSLISSPLHFFFSIGFLSYVFGIASSYVLSLVEGVPMTGQYLIDQLTHESILFLYYGIQGLLLFFASKSFAKYNFEQG